MTMQKVEINISDDILDRVLSFLEILPKDKVAINLKNSSLTNEKRDSIVDFFKNSPLSEYDILIERDKQKYTPRVQL